MKKSLIILLLFIITALFSISGSDEQFGNLNFDFRTCSTSSEPLFFTQSTQILKSNTTSEEIDFYLSKGECLIQTNTKSKRNENFFLFDFPVEKLYNFITSQPLLSLFHTPISNRAPPVVC